MAGNTHIGMDTYERLVQGLRAEGKPIGPKHHEFNAQFKKWEARQKNLGQLQQAREIKKVKGQLNKAKNNLQAARERIATKAAELNADAGLREKFVSSVRQKISDGYKTPEWDTTTGKIKSVGNGL